MMKALLGKKVGMTQLFDQDGLVVPVTVVNIAQWYVTQIKTVKNDNYSSLQLGLLKEKHQGKEFSSSWLTSFKDYFSFIREVSLKNDEHKFAVGQQITANEASLVEGDVVDVTGRSRGLGFQGVIKRWGFSRGPETHGSTFHRRPGAMGYLCKEGEVDKGKKLPGHQGNRQITTQGLRVVKIDEQAQCLFIKGSIPGKKGTVIVVSKQEMQ